ncbi:MAG: hypothetical protein ACYTXI_19285 [Nostoc sp.]
MEQQHFLVLVGVLIVALQQAHDYIRLMHKKITRAGVKILKHIPALELLVDTEGLVAG